MTDLMADPPRKRPWTTILVVVLILFNAAGLGYLWLAGNHSQSGGARTANVQAPGIQPQQLAAASRDQPEAVNLGGLNTPPPPAEAAKTPTLAEPSTTALPASPPPAGSAAPPSHPPAEVAKASMPAEPSTAAPPVPPPSAEAARTPTPANPHKKAHQAPLPEPEAGTVSTAAKSASPPSAGKSGASRHSHGSKQSVSTFVIPKAGSPVAVPEQTRYPTGSVAPGSGPRGSAEGGRPTRPDDPPFLKALSLEFRERMPPFRINLFAYSDIPADRFVIIDMKKYKVGDEIPGGAHLLEVRPDSLVLELQGTKFQVPRI